LTKSIQIYGTEKTGFSVATPITSEVTYQGLFDLVGVNPSSTNQIKITLDGI